jgi:hypothetical protein
MATESIEIRQSVVPPLPVVSNFTNGSSPSITSGLAFCTSSLRCFSLSRGSGSYDHADPAHPSA